MQKPEDLRRSPSFVIALSWMAGMGVFLATAGERAAEQLIKGSHATIEDAGPDAAPPNPWEDAARPEDDLEYLLDDEEGGADEEDAGEGGEWVPPSEDASYLLVAMAADDASDDLEDGGEIADLDDDVEGTEANRGDGGRAGRVASASAGAAGSAAPLTAQPGSSSFTARSSGESAVMALAASWPLVAQPGPDKEDRARRLVPIDARAVGMAAIRAIDVAWGVDPAVAELPASDEHDPVALARALTHETAIALRARFRAVVPPMGSLRVLERDRGAVLWMGDVAPFGPAEGATLTRPAARDLARLAPVLAAIPDRRFRVVVPLGASTDDGGVPILSTSLGVARARAVARVLVGHGLLPSHLDLSPADAADRALASELWSEGGGAGAKSGLAIVLEPRSPPPITEPASRATRKTGSHPGKRKP